MSLLDLPLLTLRIQIIATTTAIKINAPTVVNTAIRITSSLSFSIELAVLVEDCRVVALDDELPEDGEGVDEAGVTGGMFGETGSVASMVEVAVVVEAVALAVVEVVLLVEGEVVVVEAVASAVVEAMLVVLAEVVVAVVVVGGPTKYQESMCYHTAMVSTF